MSVVGEAVVVVMVAPLSSSSGITSASIILDWCRFCTRCTFFAIDLAGENASTTYDD